MKRTNIYLSERQLDKLQKASQILGGSVAEYVRRAVDVWLESMADVLRDEQKRRTKQSRKQKTLSRRKK